MDDSSKLVRGSSENLILADGNIYQQIYLNQRQTLNKATPDCSTEQAEQLGATTDGSLNIIYETGVALLPDQLVYSMKNENVILNSNATEDESMAVEALRQLGSGAVYTKYPLDLPILSCSTCDGQFQTTADFQAHSDLCKHSKLKCFACNEMFDRLPDFNNHLARHAADRPRTCPTCSMLFTHEKDFLEHLHTHEVNPNQCKICRVIFNRPSSLTNHMKIHNYQPGRAILNSLGFSKVDDGHHLVDSQVFVGNYASISDDIDSKTVALSSLSNIANINNWGDYDLSHGDDFNEVNIEVGQEMTIGNFEDDKSNIVAVTYECLNEESIGYQEEEVNNTEALLPQVTTSVNVGNANRKPYVCRSCNKSFMRKKALISHQKLHSSLVQMYNRCKDCDEYLTDDESLIKHAMICGREKLNQSTSSNEVQTSKEQTKVLVSNPKSKFYKHVCSACSKHFSTKQKLHRHMWIHRKKLFTCEICGNSFEKQEELDTHRLSTHQGNAAYVCNECGKCFTSRQGLWEHNRIHGDMSHLFKCTECSKTFSSRQGYLIHKRAHNDERPYGCRFCWKSFRDGGTLRKHERIHTGERPHACPLCTRAFNQKVVLREHVRWLHAANRNPNENGVYDCTMCEQKLTDRDDLCAHIVKHSDHMALLAKDAAKNGVGVLPSEIKECKVKVKNSQSNKVKIEIVPAVGANLLNLIDDAGKPLIECDLCGDKFVTENDLTEHVRIHI